MPFRTADGTSSPVLDDLIGGPAAALTAVALVATEAARASGWAPRAAAALAAGWRGSRRVVLADLDLERPSLHEAAGIANEEGVVDLIDFGVSLHKLVRPSLEGTFDVLPAGLFALDAAAVLRHDAWGRVLHDVAVHRSTLLAYVPADADGADAVIRRAGAVLVLAEGDDGAAVVERLAHPYSVLAILCPQTEQAPAEEVPAAPGDTIGAAASAGALAGEPEDATGAAAPAAALAGEPEDAAAEDVLELEVVDDEREDAAAEDILELGVVDDEPEEDILELEVVDDEPWTATSPASFEPPAPEHETEDAALEVAAPDFDEGPLAGPLPGFDDAVAASGSAPEPEDHAVARDGAPARTADADDDLGAARRPSDREFDRPPQDRESREALIVELRDRQRAARLAGEAGAPAAAAPVAPAGDEGSDVAAAALVLPGAAGDVAREVELESRADAVGLETIVPPPRRRAKRSPYRHALAWTGGVVLLASLLAGAWHFLGARLTEPDPVAAVPEPAPAPPAPAPLVVEDALPWVVAIEAHRDLVIALERVADLRMIEPELAFHIEPLERAGVLYYHVMGGPVPDSATATALRDTLIARGHKTGATPTDIRATPLAYLIGDYASAEAALEQVDVLRRLDLPGYVLQASAADGEPVFRLYVGGFAGEAEAGPVGQMLRAAGIRDTLVTRTGAVRFGAQVVPPDSVTTDSTATGSITP